MSTNPVPSLPPCVSPVCLLRCGAAVLKDPFIASATVLLSILCMLACVIHPTVPKLDVRALLSLTCSVLLGYSLNTVSVASVK